MHLRCFFLCWFYAANVLHENMHSWMQHENITYAARGDTLASALTYTLTGLCIWLRCVVGFCAELFKFIYFHFEQDNFECMLIVHIVYVSAWRLYGRALGIRHKFATRAYSVGLWILPRTELLYQRLTVTICTLDLWWMLFRLLVCILIGQMKHT